MSSFKIQDPGREVKLADGKAEVRYDVRHEGASSVLARAGIIATPDSAAAWIRIDGKAERLLQAGESTVWTAHVAVPQGAPAGAVKFQLQVVDADQPDDRGSQSSQSEFVIAASKKPLPWKWIAIGAGAVVAIGVALFFLLTGGIEVPALEGRPIQEVRAELTKLGLTIEEKGQVGSAPENTVVSQDPAPGTKLDKGKPVQVVFELPDVVIPNLVGQSLESAVAAVNALSLNASPPEIVNEVPAQQGKVLETNPAANTRVKPGTAFTWKVEQPTVPVPNVVGQRFQDAALALDQQGFQHEMVVVERDAAKQGQVLTQNPVSGAFVQQGKTKIQLEVEKSRIACPNVTGLSQAQAVQALTDAKLVPKILPQGVLLTGGTVGNVAIQSPAPGAPMFEQGEVQLTLVGEGVATPDVLRAGSFDNASQIIARKGLIAAMQPVHTTNIGEIGRIVGQDPAPGTIVLKGSPVSVSVLQTRWIVDRVRLEVEAIERSRVKLRGQ